jgi:ATP-binding cassette subfamily A (ABC1) protein 3
MQFYFLATGAQFSNIFKPLSSVDEMTLGHVLFMFLFDTVLYLLLTLYVEAVLPSNFGIRKPWYFIFRVRCHNKLKSKLPTIVIHEFMT